MVTSSNPYFITNQIVCNITYVFLKFIVNIAANKKNIKLSRSAYAYAEEYIKDVMPNAWHQSRQATLTYSILLTNRELFNQSTEIMRLGFKMLNFMLLVATDHINKKTLSNSSLRLIEQSIDIGCFLIEEYDDETYVTNIKKYTSSILYHVTQCIKIFKKLNIAPETAHTFCTNYCFPSQF